MIEEAQIKTYKDFPTTRYQGSKRKILSWLHENLNGIEFNTVLDAFGGTGAVSFLFKTMGKSVTYNDSLRFNQIIGKAIIENTEIVLSEEEIDDILNLSDVENNPTFIEDNFSDIYFTDEENRWLDKFYFKLNSKFTDDGVDQYKKALAYYGVFQACLTKRPYNLFHRKNLYMRLNNVKRNFGNKATWEKPFPMQVRKFIIEANNSIFSNENHCYSLNENAMDLEGNYDLVYIDPPYVDINGDHDTVDYLYCYHFLEGFSNYDCWNDSIDFETKNLRFQKTLYPTEFKRRNVLNSFNELFEKFQDSIIVVSYKKNGIPSIEEIEILLKKYKQNVRIESMHYKYALNKQNGNAKDNREVLFIAR